MATVRRRAALENVVRHTAAGPEGLAGGALAVRVTGG
jgi:hypothetical protein